MQHQASCIWGAYGQIYLFGFFSAGSMGSPASLQCIWGFLPRFLGSLGSFSFFSLEKQTRFIEKILRKLLVMCKLNCAKTYLGFFSFGSFGGFGSLGGFGSFTFFPRFFLPSRNSSSSKFSPYGSCKDVLFRKSGVKQHPLHWT